MPKFRSRKTVIARRITLKNMESIAKWCGMEIAMEADNGFQLGLIGDWVVKIGERFTSMTDEQFHESYERVSDAPRT